MLVWNVASATSTGDPRTRNYESTTPISSLYLQASSLHILSRRPHKVQMSGTRVVSELGAPITRLFSRPSHVGSSTRVQQQNQWPVLSAIVSVFGNVSPDTPQYAYAGGRASRWFEGHSIPLWLCQASPRAILIWTPANCSVISVICPHFWCHPVITWKFFVRLTCRRSSKDREMIEASHKS